MNIRLVAYRPATTATTSETTYELDLQEAPNVSLNFQFSDIKEPETRKASYSQTFKLPFTDANNEFFQNWYNVNLTTLVFSTRTKFNATLYVGTIPQFEGFIQLKAVYQKAQYYEVVLMSNTADLFTRIGEESLKDAFLEKGVYSKELNHTYNNANIGYSWVGGGSSFVNVPDGDSLRDASAGVQKVMYPISVTRDKFFYTANSNQYLDMSSSLDADYIVDIEQFRPSIQLKTLVKKIIGKAGFSYTSSFIDGSYFGKLFMTTGNTLEEPRLPTVENTSNLEGGSLDARNDDFINDGYHSYNPDNCQLLEPNSGVQIFQADNEINDTSGAWDSTNNIFHKVSPTMQELTIEGRCRKYNVLACGTNLSFVFDNTIPVDIVCYETDAAGVETGEILYSGTMTSLTGAGTSLSNYFQLWSYVIPLADISVGARFRIKMIVPEVETTIIGQARFQLQRGALDIDGTSYYSRISCTWLAYTPGQWGATVDVPACIDPTITQKAFLKDIIERFNLVIMSDPDNASNIIIEPYDDFLDGSTLKHWTDKLDVSKEVIVKDTTSLQKKIISFTDKEDVDLVNKAIKEELPSANVWGKYYNDKTENDFATGELKNNPVFSPYINQQVFKNPNEQDGTDLPSMAIQYEISYKEVEFGYEAELKATKPKLFYYSGAATNINGTEETQVLIYMHKIDPTDASITAYFFNTYPLCSAWDITTTGSYQLSSSNKSLNWSFVPPVAPELTVFSYSNAEFTLSNNSLYYLYWQNYLNNIYNSDARIMECHLNLNEVDIFDFKFNDEIFIKDSYWRVLTISNYQVGEKASTKVTLLKVLDTLSNAEGCDSVPVGISGNYLTWCPEGTPGCTPETVGYFSGIYISPACCYAYGGEPFGGYTDGLGNYACLANTGSLPINFQSQKSPLSGLGFGQLKTLMSGKISGRNVPLIKGVDTSKYANSILPYFGDDIIIKYKSSKKGNPLLQGEAHKIILLGHTEGNTRGYAYPEDDSNNQKIIIPPNCNMMVNVNGVSTVIGGSSTTYPLGDTESFNYNTVFVSKAGTVSQIGIAGGVLGWSIKDVTTTSTLYISQTDNELLFGLDDSQTDTKKSWALTVEIMVQRIPSIMLPYKANWALWQNYDHIVLENEQFLLWN
jgi:hypothetical protein